MKTKIEMVINYKSDVELDDFLNYIKMRVCEYEVVNESSIPDEINKSAPSYDTCEDMLEDIDKMDLYTCRSEYNNIPEAKDYLNSVTSSTSFWKKALINILHAEYGFEDCPDDALDDAPDDEFYSKPRTEKKKFTKALEEYLRDFNENNWDKIMTFLDNKNLNSAKGIITTSYQLNDYRTVITKLKSLTKDGKFKKKELLKSLGI